jgi:hypothetical protein
MKPEKYLSEKELIEKAVYILTKELGPTETARFINLPREKRVESVKRHHRWQNNLDKELFFKEIFG